MGSQTVWPPIAISSKSILRSIFLVGKSLSTGVQISSIRTISLACGSIHNLPCVAPSTETDPDESNPTGAVTNKYKRVDLPLSWAFPWRVNRACVRGANKPCNNPATSPLVFDPGAASYTCGTERPLTDTLV